MKGSRFLNALTIFTNFFAKGFISQIIKQNIRGGEKGVKGGDKKISPMEPKILQPSRNFLDISGKLTYSESLRAWAHVRLKKDIVQEFTSLKERRSRFSYQILFYRSFAELEREIRKMKRKRQGLPFLMFIKKEDVGG